MNQRFSFDKLSRERRFLFFSFPRTEYTLCRDPGGGMAEIDPFVASAPYIYNLRPPAQANRVESHKKNDPQCLGIPEECTPQR